VAYDYGLIDRIVEPDDLIQTAQDLLADSVSATAQHSAAIKAMIDAHN